MKTVQEVSEVTYTHTYMLSLKMMTWATILVIAVMGGLYAFLGLPPALDTYYAKMYFHSIGIGIAALATYLVISIFGIQKYEPPIDFPISYRAFAAVMFAAVGGLFYLNPLLDASFTDIPLGLYIVAFILIGDVGAALFIQLLILPRKQAGTYKPSARPGPPRMVPQYFLRIFPKREELSLYLKAGASYWLALVAVGSALIAGMIGFVNLWVRIFGLSFFSGYASYLGLDAPGFIGATLDPHSHEIALAIMAGIVALAAQEFKVLDLKGLKKNVAKVGLWVTSIGVVAMTIVFLAVAFANFSPPTLFASGPSGVNGMAGDDTVMSFIALGAMIVLVPLALTRLNLKSSWKDSVRLALFGTWVAAVIISVVQAFYIEFHEDIFGSTLAANDAVFAEFQPMFGIFLLVALSLLLLAVDYYQDTGWERRLTGWLAGIGLFIATVGGTLWAFGDPTTGALFYWIHVLGVFVIGISALAAAGAIYKTRIFRISHSELQ